jgi:hypothetical protein
MRAATAIEGARMPLPDWLKARDEIEEPQPRAAMKKPDPEPEDEAPEAQVIEDEALEDEAPDDEAPEDDAPEDEVEPDEEPETAVGEEPLPEDEPLQPQPTRAKASKPKAKKAKTPEPQAKKPRDLMTVALDPSADPEPSKPQAPVAKDVPSTGNDQVLSMLSSIEKQLTRLGDVQQQHEDQLAELVDRAQSGPPAGAADDQPPAQKQPSFVVEMDDEEPAPDAGPTEGLAMLASGLKDSRKQAGKMQQQLQEAQARIHGRGDEPGDGAELQEATEQLDAANEKIDELKARIIELEAVASVTEVPDTDAGEKDAQIAALTSEVRQLQAELRSRKESAAEAAAKPAPAPDSPGAEMIARQRKQIERLTEQLDAANAGVDPKEIQARDARIAKLEEELEEARGQGGGKQAVSKLVAGVGGALRQVRGKKDDEEDFGGVAELEERVAELEIERKHARDEADEAKREAEQLRQALQNAADGEGGSDAFEVAALRARVAELESAPNAGHAELRSKIEAELRQKWNEVKQKQDALKVSEEKMRRKWARPRAVVVFAHLAGLALVVGILSWLLAGGLFPATIAAAVNIEAKSKSGAPVSDKNKAQWQQVHTAMLESDSFLQRVSERLTEQRFDGYEDPEVLAERLEDDLTVDSAKAGSITLTLAGKDRTDTTFVLDTLASTLAMESAQKAGTRSDDAVAIVRGERRDKGQVRYATIRDKPISDRRPMGAAVLFVLGFAGSFVGIQRLQRTLVKTKSAMEDDDLTAGADLF